ncbi:MAG: sporulation protein YunB [Ruminiclostridium sp.]|nr:sporulation protein YunB [Ruminiclostridium sp.]
MRRYTEARYIPYVRVRYRTRSGRSFPVKVSFQDIAIFMRYIMCIVCLILTLSNLVNKFNTVASSISENNVVDCINDCIDRGVPDTKKSYMNDDFIIIQKSSDNRVLSIKNDVANANWLASALSDRIFSDINNIERKNMKVYTDSSGIFFENGILSSLMMKIPYKVVPDGKVNVTPEFTVENLNTNQKIHRLKMNISVKIKIIFPFYRKEKLINRVIVISETIISE